MTRRWIDIAVVAAAVLVAGLWTGDATVAALPALVYAITARADRRGSCSAA